MGRVHLFEFNDQPWIPDAWRRYITEYLQFMMEHGPFDELPKLIGRVCEGENEDVQIVDLCSGSGGPWPAYLEEPMDEFDGVEVLLTDLHPNTDAFRRIEERTDGRVAGHREAVDATEVPEQCSGPRTIVNGLHQFQADTARAILADAVDAGVPIGVYEVMDRRIPTLISTLFVPLFVILLTPLVRPFRPGRLFWTYLIPVVPLLIFWDGLVSALRVYSPEELRKLTAELDEYEWEIDSVPAGKGPQRVTYLIGRQKQ